LTLNSTDAQVLQILMRERQEYSQQRARLVDRLREQLLGYYPAALEAFEDLGAPETLELLSRAPTPARGARLSFNQIAAALRRANIMEVDTRAAAIQSVLRAPHPEAATLGTDSYATVVSGTVELLVLLNRHSAEVEAEIACRANGAATELTADD
jgi:hypothetical protein